MGNLATILMFLVVFLHMKFFFCSSLNKSRTDEFSLLAVKALVDSHTLALNWSNETSFCTWIGVTCGRRHVRVTGLNLSNMHLQGTIAREIGNLSFLTFLDISNNSITGPIPDEVGNLRRLRVFDVALNRLNGHIPQSIGMLRRLEGLDLSNNYLSGDIPTSVSECVHLRDLNLSYNNLTGSIPAGFRNLSELQTLVLRTNQLTGELPPTIFNISSMRILLVGENQLSGGLPKQLCTQPSILAGLGLFSNQFEGEIPSTILHCRSLRQLSLGVNRFTGNIPSELWNLSKIERIFLRRNGFTGMISPSIRNFSNLVALDFGENNFHGTIPSEIGQLSSLTSLILETNMLNGEVPQSIFNLSSLQILSLGRNNLSGTIPSSIDKGLPNIVQFVLVDNRFRGEIPTSISNLSQLKVLELSSNSFSGTIPITLGNLRRLQFLNLMSNQLTNNMSNPNEDFLSSLTSCDLLDTIAISINPITGVLPKSLGLGNLSLALTRFLAGALRITSPLPNEIGNISNLLLLDLAYNELTGAIPATLGSLSNLQNLNIDGNDFQGSIFHVLCNLTSLYSVNLAGNSFVGQLPSCLGNLSLLREVNLTDNAFSSNIPSALWINGRFETIDFSNNFLDGSLSQEIGNLRSLIQLDLSGNQLSGGIPSTISQLQNLIMLSLSNNRLNGSIIESFADLKDLKHLDLSGNNLSGRIPKSLEKLVYLSYFNVSFNELTGEIPDEGPFANFTAEFFEGNKGLCGAPRFKVEECERNTTRTSSGKSKLVKYILPPVASVVVIAFILTTFLRCRGRNALSSSQLDSSLGPLHERISYHEILRATNNLGEENLIGRGSFGSVYVANFSNTMVAAVKVFDLEVQGALKSFDIECQVMRSVRHRNLVKVITSCSNLDFKAIVMAYMPKGNLAKWLYTADCSLNIFQRMGVMIDVASAVQYLHEGYTTPIVHCDLKPHNILLDEDMVAHVGDFGIAKLLSEEQRMQQTRTLGTIGYMAPEYGSEGLVSTMVDVYSYGILLMEVFSRRKPTDEMFSGEFTMRRWMSESFPDSIMNIVDDGSVRVSARQQSCLTSTIELALECTADMPEERPNMKDVLARMKLNLSNCN